MRLLECQGKDLLRQHGIDVPQSVTVTSPDDLDEVSLPFPWMMKAQVPAGKRNQDDGIIRVDSAPEARKRVEEMLHGTVQGYPVNAMLIEEYIPHDVEHYLAVIIDRERQMPVLLYGRHGGVNVEETNDVLRLPVHQFVGLQDYQLRQLGHVADAAQKLYQLFRAYDCQLAEINPLAEVNDKIVALDAKIIIDDNALFRHPDLPRERSDLSPLEWEAQRAGLAFVELDGNIGVIANGAGLTMATLDALESYGGRGMFLDLAGTDSAATVKKAFQIMVKASPDVIFVNLFGGITKCDTVARGILDAIEETGVDVPVVARIRGTNEQQAAEMFQDTVIAMSSFEEAARTAAKLGRKP
ncbi:MAG: succinate--CoA ligase subunit beta [Thermoplasmatota archaeon]